jgi:hypothetical protein
MKLTSLRKGGTTLHNQPVPSAAQVGGIVVVPALHAHATYFRSAWIVENTLRIMREPSWDYQLFQWDNIILQSGLECFAAVQGPRVEGFLAVRAGKDFIVEYLATAPWNFGPSRQVRRVGAGLLGFAVNLSLDRGYSGEVSLASTPASEGFYARWHFQHTGARGPGGLKIFHLSAIHVPGVLSVLPTLPSYITAQGAVP